MERHTILFLPFMILPAGRWLSEIMRAKSSAWVGVVILAALGVHGIKTSFGVSNFDYRIVRDLAFEKAHPDETIYAYPPKYYYGGRRLMWKPEPTNPMELPPPVPEDVRSCVLIVVLDHPSHLATLPKLVWDALQGTELLETIHNERNIKVYRLSGIPDGAIRRLVRPMQPEQPIGTEK